MIKLISTSDSIGLERTPSGIKCARLVNLTSSPNLFILEPDHQHVKQLYINHPIITTGIEGKEVLIRPLHLPLVKEKDIEEALAFQAEPLLPYPADQAYLAYQVVFKTSDSTDLTLLAVTKEALKTHLEDWKSIGIEPEKVASIPSALCEFGSAFLSREKTFLILHLNSQEMTCSLIKEGKLLASFFASEGLNLLFAGNNQQGTPLPCQSEEDWKIVEQQSESPLFLPLKRLQKEVTKMGLALAKECKKDSIDGIIVTGEAAGWKGLSQIIIRHLNLNVLTCIPTSQHSSEELQLYAVPIGLALSALQNCSQSIDFRQQELMYPHPWRRLRLPLILYFISVLLLSALFYFFSQQYLRYEESQIKQEYIDLLTSMSKSHKDFEMSFAAKTPGAHDLFDGEIPKIEQLRKEDFAGRLAFLQKELQGSPDSFPLFANIPRVSDVLAWLTLHPAVVSFDEEGNKQVKLQIENFSYTMLKRPEQGKKQEKYQVKVELEFTSPTPKWAREFHDALIVPNDWIDPKAEVKWNSNRGKYKTSFFLKDKTTYPS
ncbi:MAG: hypothetical protein ACH350_06550 [Parachlamydiaceae bacterium]